MGRLDPQKGLHLIRHTLFWALANDAQFVLLGSGSERSIDAEFRQLKRELNDNPAFHLFIIEYQSRKLLLDQAIGFFIFFLVTKVHFHATFI